VFNQIFTEGKITVTLLIENDGDSNYLYIGVMKAASSYAMSEVLNDDSNNQCYCYKRAGEFH
jgi:hypothetical protein